MLPKRPSDEKPLEEKERGEESCLEKKSVVMWRGGRGQLTAQRRREACLNEGNTYQEEIVLAEDVVELLLLPCYHVVGGTSGSTEHNWSFI